MATTKKKTVKNKAAKKPAVNAQSKNSKIKVTPEQYHKMIREAAYYISLERTSDTVNPNEDWFLAETAINKAYSLID